MASFQDRSYAAPSAWSAELDADRPVPGKRTLVEQRYPWPVQRRAAGQPTADVHAAAAQGIATPASPLPFADRIQRLFGRHDISSIQAHTGPEAAASTKAMGAEAYATR